MDSKFNRHAYESGKDTFRSGIDIDYNPYGHQPVLFAEWERGWLDAQKSSKSSRTPMQTSEEFWAAMRNRP